MHSAIRASSLYIGVTMLTSGCVDESISQICAALSDAGGLAVRALRSHRDHLPGEAWRESRQGPLGRQVRRESKSDCFAHGLARLLVFLPLQEPVGPAAVDPGQVPSNGIADRLREFHIQLKPLLVAFLRHL